MASSGRVSAGADQATGRLARGCLGLVAPGGGVALGFRVKGRWFCGVCWKFMDRTSLAYCRRHCQVGLGFSWTKGAPGLE